MQICISVVTKWIISKLKLQQRSTCILEDPKELFASCLQSRRVVERTEESQVNNHSNFKSHSDLMEELDIVISTSPFSIAAYPAYRVADNRVYPIYQRYPHTYLLVILKFLFSLVGIFFRTNRNQE